MNREEQQNTSVKTPSRQTGTEKDTAFRSCQSLTFSRNSPNFLDLKFDQLKEGLLLGPGLSQTNSERSEIQFNIILLSKESGYFSQHNDQDNGLMTEEAQFDSRNRQIFFFTTTIQTRPTQPPSQWVLEGLPSELKRSGREADTHRTGASVNSVWCRCTATHTYLAQVQIYLLPAVYTKVSTYSFPP